MDVTPTVCKECQVDANCTCNGRKKTPSWRGSCLLLLIDVISLALLNVGSLLAFGALRYFERHFLTFFKGLEAVHLNCGKVGELIFTAVIRSDKSEAFGIVEPLDGTCCHKSVFQILTDHTSRISKKLRVTLPPPKLLTSIDIPITTVMSINTIVPAKNIKVKAQSECFFSYYKLITWKDSWILVFWLHLRTVQKRRNIQKGRPLLLRIARKLMQ